MGFISNLLKHVPTAVKSAERDLRSELGSVEHVASTAGAIVKDAFDAGRYLASHPPDLAQIERIGSAAGKALVTGQTQVIEGRLPPYPTLDPAAVQGAIARGAGKTVAQPFIAGSPDGTGLHEPVNLVVTGTEAQLETALTKAGWERAPELTRKSAIEEGAKVLLGLDRDTNGPVSTKYLGGQPEALAFNKNDDYSAGRDHLRVWPTTPDPVTGAPRWQIAASRDLAMAITPPKVEWDGLSPHLSQKPSLGHRADRRVDGERDLLMQSLLDTGLVKDWAAVPGAHPAGTSVTPQPDGKVKLNGQWLTDGLVFTATL